MRGAGARLALRKGGPFGKLAYRRAGQGEHGRNAAEFWRGLQYELDYVFGCRNELKAWRKKGRGGRPARRWSCCQGALDARGGQRGSMLGGLETPDEQRSGRMMNRIYLQ